MTRVFKNTKRSKKDILFNSYWINKIKSKNIKKGKKYKLEHYIYKNIKIFKFLKLDLIKLTLKTLEKFKPLIHTIKYYVRGQNKTKKDKKKFHWVPVPLKLINQYKKSVTFFVQSLLNINNKDKKKFNLIKLLISVLIFKKSDLLYFNKILVFKNLKSRAFKYFRWK